MSPYSLNVSGFLGDVTVVEKLFDDLKSLLSKPEYGVTNSQFTGLGKWENNFHQDSAALEGGAAGQTSDPAAPGAEGTADDAPAAPPAGGDTVADGSDTDASPGA